MDVIRPAEFRETASNSAVPENAHVWKAVNDTHVIHSYA